MRIGKNIYTRQDLIKMQSLPFERKVLIAQVKITEKQYDYVINKLGLGELLDYVGVVYR